MALQDQPLCLGTPVHEGHDTTPEVGQYDSSNPDNLDEDLTSQLDPDSEEEYTDATGQSGRSITVEHNQRRNCTMCRERAHAKHDFYRGSPSHGRKLVFFLFKETDRDNSISYRDWHAEIEAAISKGYEQEPIKVAMFEVMGGMAKDHAANIDQSGVLTALEILIDEFDGSYLRSENDVCPSEFSVTPNTSPKTTPDMSLIKDSVQPSTSKGKAQSKGKDLTLLMKPGVSYQTPDESLYFREKRMAHQKNTAPGNPQKSSLEAKQVHEPQESKLPRKTGPRTKTTL